MHVITNINNEVKWTTQHSIDTNLACLTEHDGMTKPPLDLTNFGLLNPIEFGREIWFVITKIHNVEVCYIECLLYTGNF